MFASPNTEHNITSLTLVSTPTYPGVFSIFNLIYFEFYVPYQLAILGSLLIYCFLSNLRRKKFLKIFFTKFTSTFYDLPLLTTPNTPRCA